ncbi:MAG: sodium:calcium antiporter [candidate division WOR-3 bacterium]
MFISLLPLIISVVAALPAIALRFTHMHLPPWLGALVFGAGIVSAAYMLSVACEVAQLDLSRALAIALLAILAVLPEYAVDFYFAWMAPHVPEYTHYATANMTGANRLLIGFGWSFLIFLFWLKTRRSGIALEKTYGIELSFLAIATLYSFVIPLKGRLDLLDSVVLVFLFGLYMFQAARAHKVEPELEGCAATLGCLIPGIRRPIVVFLFLYAGLVILASTEPFAESLLALGRAMGIDEFILVQWLAPLASESPEIIVATIFALKMHPGEGFGALVSSKVNQWTLLIGTLPLVYSLSGGRPGALHMDARQVEEVALTSAQSLFAVSILSDYHMNIWEALLLFLLFFVQLMIPIPWVRWGFTALYIILAVLLIAISKNKRRGLGSLIASPIRRMRGPD